MHDRPAKQTITLGGNEYEVVNEMRLLGGMVLRRGDVYARLGPKAPTLEEQIHTLSLFERGFPVPRVLESGAYSEDHWYFTEESLGDEPFHKLFCREYAATGTVSDASFEAYMGVIEAYTRAQMSTKNKSSVSALEFVRAAIPSGTVIPNYIYFNYDPDEYQRAIAKAAHKLEDAPMGLLQYDLNPYNVMKHGIIDFELAGYGPVGYDTLMSIRWGEGWFTDYPSRYPLGYKFSPDQVKINDELIDGIATANELEPPTRYMQEFLLLKSAWALSDIEVPKPDWPQDRIAFRQFRANVLNAAVKAYLADKPLDYTKFSSIPGGDTKS